MATMPALVFLEAGGLRVGEEVGDVGGFADFSFKLINIIWEGIQTKVDAEISVLKIVNNTAAPYGIVRFLEKFDIARAGKKCAAASVDEYAAQ